MDDKIVMCSSKNDDNTWFIFREDGKEVKFTIKNKIIKSFNYKLTADEMNYIRENLLL